MINFLQSKNIQPLQLILAAFILLFSLLSGLFIKGLPVDLAQAPNWFYNYSLGYTHRGIMGTIFQFFHGEPSMQKVQSIIPMWEYYLCVILILAAWCLLVPRILLMPLEQYKKWALLAMAAVLLLSPIWKTSVINVGFMDEWILLMVFISFSMLLLNRPWLYLIGCCLGFLIHPMMLFYALILVMLICHAVYFIPRYQLHYKKWLAVAILPLLFSSFLHWLHNPQHYITLLSQYNFEHDFMRDFGHNFAFDDFLQHILFAYSEPNQTYSEQFAKWGIFPRNFFLGIIIFAVPSFLFSILFAFCLKSIGISFKSPITIKFKNKYPSLVLIDKYNLFILLPLASLFILPIHTVANDWSRFFYMAWWGIAIVYSYILWSANVNNTLSTVRTTEKQNKQNKQNKYIVQGLTVVFVITAYTLGGAPLNVSHINRPWVFACRQFCIPYLTINPLGQHYSSAIFSILVKNLVPIHATAEQMRNILLHNSKLAAMKYKNNQLMIPASYTGSIVNFSYTGAPRAKFIITVKTIAESIPNLNLSVSGQSAKKIKKTTTQTQWLFNSGNHYNFPHIVIQPEGGVDFIFTDFSVQQVN